MTDIRASKAEWLTCCDEGDMKAFLDALSDDECELLNSDWDFWMRDSQRPPQGDWFCWLVLAGRGFGKTRMGVEWVRAAVEGRGCVNIPKSGSLRIALISQTFADARDVMIEGDSGFMANASKGNRPHFEPSKKRLTWPSGAVATIYSADEPDQLRGPQHHMAWVDEMAKWSHADEAWSNLMFGLRLGVKPRVMVTTTPRPMPLLKEISTDPATVITRGSSFENKAHLSQRFLDEMTRRYGGTRLGRQELMGEMLDDVPGALWTRQMLDDHRTACAPDLVRIVVAVDPPVTHGPKADACGIVAVGKAKDGALYVLEDASVQGLSPHGWAERALGCYRAHVADRLVAEVNNGGDLVEAVIRQLAPDVSYRAVRASRGKIARAEPVAALYERGLVHHVGAFAELEDELCAYTGEGGEKSPDRLDALVWAITELMPPPRAEPRMRRI
ncbi:MAG: DNA-packaging protein [Sphingomonadales bacterium]|nr:DNA-packaging protein [Sphingomonadales bacterium]